MGYNAGRSAWDVLARDFGRPELMVIAQLKRLHSYPFIKPHETEVMKYMRYLMCKRFQPVWFWKWLDVRISFEQCGQEVVNRIKS